ncbi:MAG: mandelate racemase/muconate lactonizing enzyme family protein [Chloroflexota bacterium]
MRITSIEWQKVFVPYANPHVWGGGRRPGPTRLVVTVHTDVGLVGYGETLCLLEFTEPVLVRTIIPIAIGLDPHDVEHLYRKVEGAGFYHHKRAMVFALAAVEMACWDLVGKASGAPLHKLWGGKYRERIEMIAYLFVSDPEKVAAEARHFVERGFRTIKLKIGVDERSDVPIVKAVREAVGPDIRIRADVNGAWTPGTAKRMISRLAPFDLEYVEQPLVHDDLLGHAQLRRWSPVPIALDESAYTTTDVLNIIRAEAADVILLDPHEAGGLWQARKAASICEAAGIPVTLHSGGELGFSTAAYLHLAASTPNMFLAIDGQQHNQTDDVVPDSEVFRYDHGCFMVPSGPGLGMSLDEAKLARNSTETIREAYLDVQRPEWFAEKPAY